MSLVFLFCFQIQHISEIKQYCSFSIWFISHRIMPLKSICAQLLSHVLFFVTPSALALRLFRPWDFPGKNIGVRWHFLLQGIFLSWELNPCLLQLLHWQLYSLPLNSLGNPEVHLWCCKWQDSLLFYGWIIFLCIHTHTHTHTHTQTHTPPTLSFSSHPWVDTWVFSTSCLLQIMLQRMWECKYLLKTMISLPSDTWLRVK